MKDAVDFCSQGWCLPVCPASSHCCRPRFFPSPPWQSTQCLLSLEGLLFQEKLSTELWGITAAGPDHGEQVFPTGCFSFLLPWGFGGIDIKALSLYCFMEIHLSETLGIIVVQNESRYLIVSPLITEMERLETLICLLFFLL